MQAHAPAGWHSAPSARRLQGAFRLAQACHQTLAVSTTPATVLPCPHRGTVESPAEMAPLYDQLTELCMVGRHLGCNQLAGAAALLYGLSAVCRPAGLSCAWRVMGLVSCPAMHSSGIDSTREQSPGPLTASGQPRPCLPNG